MLYIRWFQQRFTDFTQPPGIQSSPPLRPSGPKEQSANELQPFQRPVISVLIRLWKHEIQLSTPSWAPGERQ